MSEDSRRQHQERGLLKRGTEGKRIGFYSYAVFAIVLTELFEEES